MKTLRSIVLVFVLCAVALTSLNCKQPIPTPDNSSGSPATLKFSLTIDKEICQRNKYKRTPQFAIWLENPDTKEIHTVCVTHKTAKGKWGGTITRPVSLPRWVSRWNKETQSTGDPTAETPAAEAVTRATPDADFSVSTEVLSGQTWDYYVEVNVSGDHNEHFPPVSPAGKKDAHSNGQPSIVYKGTIEITPDNKSTPQLIGRTDQFQPTASLIEDLTGITTAKQLFSRLEAECLSEEAE